MSPHRRLPPALDRRFVAALAATPTEAFDWRELHRRGRTKPSWSALSLSGILHVTLFLALSAAVVPVDLGELSVLLAEISAEPEEVPLETLAVGPEPGPDGWPEPAAASAVIESPQPLEQLAASDPELADFALTELPKTVPPQFPRNELLMDLPDESEPDDRRVTSIGKWGAEGDHQGPQAAEYFGTVARGDRFVWVLDKSSSMSDTRGPQDRSRFDRAVAELLRSLDQLKPAQSFYVVLFSSRMQPMFDEETVVPQMLPATPENKKRLQEWILSIHPGGSTDPREALQFALSIEPSAVFMLSDGAFGGLANSKGGDMFGADSAIGQLVGQKDRDQVPIHSFAYEDPNAKANMQALASLTGGQYRYIQPETIKKDISRDADAEAEAAGLPSQTTTLAQRQPLTAGQQADALLRLADNLRAAGKHDKALRRYRDLIYQYPLTPAAAAARGRIVQMKYTMRMGPR